MRRRPRFWISALSVPLSYSVVSSEQTAGDLCLLVGTGCHMLGHRRHMGLALAPSACFPRWRPGFSEAFRGSTSLPTLSIVSPYIFLVFIYLFFVFSRATLAAYGGSQARGLIGTTAASLHHRHSHARSEPHLQPTPQPTATLDPSPTERGQGLNLQPHGS